MVSMFVRHGSFKHFFALLSMLRKRRSILNPAWWEAATNKDVLTICNCTINSDSMIFCSSSDGSWLVGIRGLVWVFLFFSSFSSFSFVNNSSCSCWSSNWLFLFSASQLWCLSYRSFVSCSRFSLSCIWFDFQNLFPISIIFWRTFNKLRRFFFCSLFFISCDVVFSAYSNSDSSTPPIIAPPCVPSSSSF